MTATTPENPTHDAEHDARTGSRPKEPENVHTTPQDQPGPEVDPTLPTDLDVHPKPENETDAKVAREHADREHMESLDVSGEASDAPPPKDDVNEKEGFSGEESTGISLDAMINEEQPSQSVEAPAEQSAMEIDTPTAVERQPLDESAAELGFQPSFTTFTPNETVNVDLDLLPHIPGLYRLLDLYLERGSNDNFEKVVIDHDSMGDAMNALREGSYKTISKINFSTLDTVPIKPLGIYGSKSAIVQFLLDAGVVEEPVAEALRKPVNQNGQLFPYLRSGIYLLINAPPSHLQASSSTVIHVIYWPEDETWNDNASSSVQKNRVTFMRYLTKLASDIRVLVSEEHAASFVWKYDANEEARDQGDESSSDEDSDADDRFVKFEVAKAVDEEEGVQVFPGFTFRHQALGLSDHSSTTVQLVPSETSQAFLVTTIREAGFQQKQAGAEYTALGLKSLMRRYKDIYLGEKIGEASIHSIFELGAFPTSASEIYLEYLKLDTEAPEAQEQRSAALSQLQSELVDLRKHVEHLVRQRFIHHYPSLGLKSGLDSDCAPENYLGPLLEMAPKAKAVYDNYQRQTVPDKIESPEYQAVKERFLDVQGILEGSESIKEEEKRRYIQGICSPDSSKEASSSKAPKRSRSLIVATIGTIGTIGSAVKGLVYSTDRQNKSSQKFSRSSFGRNDVEFLATVDSYSAFPDYTPAVQAIQTAAKTWVEGRIAETTEELARTLFKKIEISTHEYANQQYKWTKFAECRWRGDVDRKKEKEERARKQQRSNQHEPLAHEASDEDQSETEPPQYAILDSNGEDPFIGTPETPTIPVPDVPSNTPTLLHRPLPLVPRQIVSPAPPGVKPPRSTMTAKLSYLRGTGEGEDPREWIQDFEYKMEEAEWDEAKAAKMFGKLMQEGSPAAKWYGALDSGEKAEYTKVKTAFDKRWPPRAQAARNMKELQQKVLDTVLTEREAGTVVEDPVRGTIGAHVLWAEKLVHRAAAAEDTKMHLYLAVKDRFPKAVKAFFQSTAAEPETWDDFLATISRVPASQLKQYGEDRALLDTLGSMDLSALARALASPSPTSTPPSIPAFSPPRYWPSPAGPHVVQQQANPPGGFNPSTPLNRQPSLLHQLSAPTAYMQSPGTPTPAFRMGPESPSTPMRGPWPRSAILSGPITPRTSTSIKLDGFTDNNQGWEEYQKATDQHKEKWGTAPPHDSRPPPRAPGTRDFGDDDCWTCGRRYHGRGFQCQSPKRVSDAEFAHRRMVGARRTRGYPGSGGVPGGSGGLETQVHLVDSAGMDDYDQEGAWAGNAYGLGMTWSRDTQPAMSNPRWY